MPIGSDWDPESRVWTLTTAATFSLDEVSALIDETDWRGGTLYIWDLRGLERGPDSSPELQQAVALVKRSRELWQGSRAALVVARELDFGVARMFQVFAEELDIEYRVFRDHGAAREWIASGSA